MLKQLLYSISFYFSRLFYITAACIIALFCVAYFFPPLVEIGYIAALCLAMLVVIDFIISFAGKKTLTATRQCSERFSNGDENKVALHITNHRNYKLRLIVIDELPVQFQERNWQRTLTIDGNNTVLIEYTLKPLERGEYGFGIINLLVYSPLGMLVRHIKTGAPQTVAVYPSFMQMRRYQLLAVTNQLQEGGSRPLRKIGQSLEFEQIRDYVAGDDYRNINWQATARKNSLMMNTFMDERSQQIVCLIDKGRTMKMPFEGMTLLDYAINATLVLSNIVLLKQDKAGLLTFSKHIDQYVPADKKSTQISLLLETLYRQQTSFTDADFEALYTTVRYRIKQRSLLILFTNFESMYGLERQLPFLKQLAGHHALLVVFFENTELFELQQQPAVTLEEVYNKAIANKFALEKKQMVKELQKHGIMALLTAPQKLTANTINRYLEIKARQVV
ncbi:DUF58 domain-containing protein [Ilyomonas limi]|uniref:DUF58 domain-containing protein n=1 Tax=Ilyomonas limi TaxID=2575867 RepID=A0A4U3KW91_9BACT|nr:DUF58 domain-containing protein [Ilyomonas limi]TKK66680.1 DUF58 domain-containing protein [Ilyomonas limi]